MYEIVDWFEIVLVWCWILSDWHFSSTLYYDVFSSFVFGSIFFAASAGSPWFPSSSLIIMPGYGAYVTILDYLYYSVPSFSDYPLQERSYKQVNSVIHSFEQQC